MNNLQIIEVKGQRVLTTRQIAEAYGATTKQVQRNFERNKSKYTVGKHYISLAGSELKMLKDRRQIDGNLKYAPVINFWTEKGALLHAKSLNTDKAWEVYDWLVDFYFRAKEETLPEPKAVPTVPKPRPMVLDMPGNREVQEKIRAIKDHCISINILLDAQNKYLEEEKVKSIQEALHAVGAYMYLAIGGLNRLEVKKIEEPL